MRPTSRQSAFTLVELLATIAIIAVLATAVMVYIPNFVTWAKQTADAQTLLVLNDALTRYKCEGGNVNALTLGAPIGNIIAKLQTPVNWAGLSHQFLQSAVTYPARSLVAVGENSQYHFFQFNTYSSETPSIDTPTSQYPLGELGGSGTGGIPYSWYSPTTITTADAALNQPGTLVGARVFGNTEYVVTLTNGKVIDFKTDGSVATCNGEGPYNIFFNGNTGNVNFNGVLNWAQYDSNPNTITLHGLTPGVKYLVQLFVCDAGSNGLVRHVNFQAVGAPTDISATTLENPPIYIIGVFTATASDMSIQENLLNSGAGNINALVLRHF